MISAFLNNPTNISYTTELEARVVLINKVRAEVNRLTPLVLRAFEPFVGQRLFKVTGGFYEKFKYLIPQGNREFQIYRSNSDYWLSFYVKSNESVGKDKRGHCTAVYHEDAISIGSLDNGVLLNIKAFEPLKCDYVVDDILKARKNVELAKEALSAAKDGLGPFGEY